ncbi:hypothetical protein BBJ28_00017955 [Nothophytophthora sp. Chile5]|nr:hypothetical protein BBJ28_00017955 [Nothophytophthora sp. Chile5]
MTDSQSALPECDLRLDDDEPEEEDQRRRSLSGGTSRALIVKPPPLQPAANPITDSPEQYLGGQERVYPWVMTDPGAVSVILESAMMTSTTLRTAAVQSEPGPRGQKTVTTALLAGSPQSAYRRSESALGYGTNIEMHRTHSILRMSASATSSGHGLRKSASVEFVLDHVHQHKEMAQSIHASTSSIGREPRCVLILWRGLQRMHLKLHAHVHALWDQLLLLGTDDWV